MLYQLSGEGYGPSARGSAVSRQDSVNSHVERRLRIPGNMGNNSFEYLGFIPGRGSQLGVEILELNLFPPEIIPKASELTPFVFLPRLIVESMILDALANSARVLF